MLWNLSVKVFLQGVTPSCSASGAFFLKILPNMVDTSTGQLTMCRIIPASWRIKSYFPSRYLLCPADCALVIITNQMF